MPKLILAFFYSPTFIDFRLNEPGILTPVELGVLLRFFHGQVLYFPLCPLDAGLRVVGQGFEDTEGIGRSMPEIVGVGAVVRLGHVRNHSLEK